MRKLVLEIDKWETPASSYQEKQVGNYRLKKSEYAPGLYSHYFMDGYACTQVMKPIPIMLLQEHRDGEWHDWMADDPMDYRAMQKYAEAAEGKVLATGLGLGLVAHELCKNPRVTEITIVERSLEVKELTYGYIPKEKAKLIMSDFWDFVKNDDTDWDMIIVDIWVTKGKEQHRKVFQDEIVPANTYMRRKYPKSNLVFHGFADVTDVRLVEPFFKLKKN